MVAEVAESCPPEREACGETGSTAGVHRGSDGGSRRLEEEAPSSLHQAAALASPGSLGVLWGTRPTQICLRQCPRWVVCVLKFERPQKRPEEEKEQCSGQREKCTQSGSVWRGQSHRVRPARA